MPESSSATDPVRSYRDLRVWQQAMTLAEATYRATERFPRDERHGLVTQLRRAAVSVPSNIAEGHARPEQAEPLLQACDQVGRMLGALRKSLRARRARAPNP